MRARPRHDIDVGQQAIEDRPDRVGAQEHGLVGAAGVQDAVGEEMAALGVGRHLHFVDGQKGNLPVERH